MDEKDKTQDAVAQITSWCIAVAVHQRYGVGRDQLERVAAVMAKVQDEIAAIVEELGTDKGMAVLRDKLGGICETEFPVPLNRAPKKLAGAGAAADRGHCGYGGLVLLCHRHAGCTGLWHRAAERGAG